MKGAKIRRQKVSILFTPAKIGTMELSNRLIRAASHEGLSDWRKADR